MGVDETGRVGRGPVVVDLPAAGEVGAVLRGAGLRTGRPVLVVVGGAAGMADARVAALTRVLADGVVPVLEEMGGAIVDGGTDAGVVRAVGRAATDSAIPLVGVAATGTVRLAGSAPPRPDAADPEPHHTHLVRCPGTNWGDESPWIGVVAGALAGGDRVATLLANGGSIALTDVETALEAGGRVLVLAGTGRTADAVADRHDPRSAAVADSPRTHVVDRDDPAGLDAVLRMVLGR